MSEGRSGSVLWQIRSLFGRGTLAGLGEGRLIERFVAHKDERAFEVLMARHGPMVLGVCRRVLDDPRDVEDAFQATFLVLVRRRARSATATSWRTGSTAWRIAWPPGPGPNACRRRHPRATGGRGGGRVRVVRTPRGPRRASGRDRRRAVSAARSPPRGGRPLRPGGPPARRSRAASRVPGGDGQEPPQPRPRPPPRPSPPPGRRAGGVAFRRALRIGERGRAGGSPVIHAPGRANFSRPARRSRRRPPHRSMASRGRCSWRSSRRRRPRS